MNRSGRLLLLWCALASAQPLPRLTTENLLGKTVELPAATAGKTAVLIVGFSKASQSQTKPWSVRLAREFAEQGRTVVYSIAALESVPRLLRGVVARGIRSGVPAEQRDRFLLLYHNESDLKRVTGFGPEDDAYILLLDRSGSVLWRFHGAVNDAAIHELMGHVPPPDGK